MDRNYKVYVHINKVNGKRYYGITKQEVEKRWKNGYGYSSNKHFTNAINKYGWNNFEHIVIARGLTEEEAKWLEIELIKEFDTTNREYGYNITKGGDSNNGKKHTEETRKKMSEAQKGKNNPNYGKTFSEEIRKKMSEAKKGKAFSEEHREKLSEVMKGKTHTEEAKKKISKAVRGKSKGKATKVYCVELDMYFNSVREASEFVNCNRSSISKVLGKSNRTCGGYHWLRAEEVNQENINRVMSLKAGKSVYCIELDKYFDTIKQASKYVGCSIDNISSVLHGRQKTAGGYHWLRAEDVELEIDK